MCAWTTPTLFLLRHSSTSAMSPTRSGTSMVISVAFASLSWLSLNPVLECADSPRMVFSFHSTVASISSSILFMAYPLALFLIPPICVGGDLPKRLTLSSGKIPASSSSSLARNASPVPCRSTFSTSGNGDSSTSSPATRRASSFAVTSASLMPLAFMDSPFMTPSPSTSFPSPSMFFPSPCCTKLPVARLMRSRACPSLDPPSPRE
mmetsp:Transcript_12519/g.57957  ORF Transcript_12519/g.57957 Transcript_12519/m.57957 type:complete len:207 (-) Transcript_12519:647-1267(-)